MNIFLKSAGKQEGTSCVSNMVQLGDFFYLSGQTGLGESIQEQTITAINKVIDVYQTMVYSFTMLWSSLCI